MASGGMYEAALKKEGGVSVDVMVWVVMLGADEIRYRNV